MTTLKLLFIALTLTMQVDVFAENSVPEKMDIDTHSALIEKLKTVMDLSEDGVSKENIVLRLADLYSERARLHAMQDEGKGDITFKTEIQSDRKNALALYEKSIRQAQGTQKGKILLQMAQLHSLLGHNQKAKTLFDQVIKEKKNYEPAVTAQAYVELGNFEYYKQNFKAAKNHFESSLRISENSKKGYAQYRIAWCLYNLGDTELAIHKMVSLLKNKQLFIRKNGVTDTSFLEEASRDLATFYSRREISVKEIQTLAELTPENVRTSNLNHLATELDRTGKKESALRIWAIIGSSDEDKPAEDKIEKQIRIARIQYDLGKKSQTVKEIQIAVSMLSDEDCENKNQCELFKQNLRKIITDWGLAEERNPSKELVQSYKIYLDEFEDLDMTYWAALAAQKSKQHTEAFTFFSTAAELSHRSIKKSSSQPSTNSSVDVHKVFEGSLLGAIDVAEQSKNMKMRDEAYEQYLKMNPNGEKALDVEYQMAQVLLEKKEYRDAAEAFREVAYSKHTRGDLTLKDNAADLALDTLVLLKDEETLEDWALEFAKEKPARRAEFLVIARKSAVNQAAKVINTNPSESALEKQYAKLEKTDLSKSKPEERINIYKHRQLIAVQLKDLQAILATSMALLNEKSLSEKDREVALTHMAWVYETRLDFKNALAVIKKIKPSKNKEDEHILRLGVVSELAGQNPTKYYEQYLRIGNDSAKRQDVALSLIRLSSNKKTAFKKHNHHLLGSPKKYMTASLYVYDQTRNESDLRQSFQKGPFHTFEGQMLLRRQFLKEISESSKKLVRHSLKNSSQNTLRKSLQERMNLLERFEKLSQKFIDKKDFTLQFVSLSILSQETNRLAQDILRLPAPRQLNKTQKQQYKKLVQNQVAPYVEKSKTIKNKIEQLWDHKNETDFDDTLNLAAQNKAPGRTLALEEVQVISFWAKKFRLQDANLASQELAKKRQQRQKLSQEVVELRARVQRNPFDSSYLEKMRDLEIELGSGPMVAYLSSRLTQLKPDGKGGGVN